nr:DUF4386 family protein [Vallitaleaceae bacterium]
NSLDMISIGILGIMYLALFIRLKEENKSLISISLPFAFIGIAAFIVPRSILLSLNQLTQQYMGATSEVLKNQIITSGQTISVLAIPTFQTVGFFILSIASLLISIVILKTKLIPKLAGYIGIAGFLLTLIDDIFVILAPELATLFMVIGGCFWIIWWVMIGVNLLKIKVE